MGKLSPTLRPSDDAVSLHSHHQSSSYLDDDAPELQDSDLPPLYEEHASSSSASAPLLPAHPVIPYLDPSVSPRSTDANTGAEFFIDSRFDEDPAFLEKHVELWAQKPPRPFVRILGTHRETVDNKGKKERKSVTDFDVSIELTPYLFSDATNRVSWRELRTVENGEKAHRGTVFRKRAPGAKQHIEVGLAEKPTLTEWCHRYCASHSRLKCFTLSRRVVGFDEEKVKLKLESLIRSSNYRGHTQITFPVKDQFVSVYDQSKINEWRLSSVIFWICVFTLTFLITWPLLFFGTQKFAVAVAEWPFSRADENGRRQYVSISEDQWYNMWGRAINRAVLEKRQCTLDQQDLLTADAPDPTFGNAVVDGAVSFVRAGVNAMNEVNRQLGWGHDT